MKESYTFLPSTSEAVNIVDVVRRLRNDLIKDFLDERVLIEYLSTQYRIMELSRVRVQFIKADLQRLLIAPVDLERYRPIVEEYQATGSAALSDRNEKLFYKEIEEILKKYIY
jgi:hypothetical protein